MTTIRPITPETVSEAVRFTQALLDGLWTDDGIGDGTGTYDTTKQRYESYMVAGNGPSTWAVFLWDADDDISDCFVQFCSGAETTYIDVPSDRWTTLLVACRTDSRRRESPEHSDDPIAKLMETFGVDERTAISMHKHQPKEA